LLREADLSATLRAVHDVLTPGGRLVIELVADLASWQEYRGETRLRGWRPGRKAHLTLVESVRQDRRKGLTLFEQEFVERRGSETVRKRFSLAFRTLSVPQMTRRLEKAGLTVTSRLGSYDGAPWSPEADTWILVAERRRAKLYGPRFRAFLEFQPCPAIQSGTPSSTRRAPSTPSAGRCSRASSRSSPSPLVTAAATPTATRASGR
jgi:hypothetical protein